MAKAAGGEERESSLASGWTVHADPAPEAVEAQGAEPSFGEAEHETDGLEDVRRQLSNGMLVMLGVFGGLYLLYTWIWLSWVQGYAEWNAMIAAGSGSVGAVFQQAAFWVVPLAPVLWFLTVMALSRGGRTKRLVIGILIGAIVLVPLPMFFGGGA